MEGGAKDYVGRKKSETSLENIRYFVPFFHFLNIDPFLLVSSMSSKSTLSSLKKYSTVRMLKRNMLGLGYDVNYFMKHFHDESSWHSPHFRYDEKLIVIPLSCTCNVNHLSQTDLQNYDNFHWHHYCMSTKQLLSEMQSIVKEVANTLTLLQWIICCEYWAFERCLRYGSNCCRW